MTRNTLGDLNNHLFEQLERLNDEDLSGEKLQEEMSRAKAITGLASQIIANGTLVLKGREFQLEYGIEVEGDRNSGSISNGKSKKEFPPMLKADFLRE